MVDFTPYIDIMIDRTLESLLPDLCRLEIQLAGIGLQIIDGKPVREDIQYREYKGSIDIPCRLETSRAYRQADYEHDIASVFENILHFPKDLDVETTDTVILANSRVMNIVRLDDVPKWNITKIALLLGADRFGQNIST